MNRKTGLSAGIFVLLLMVAGLATPAPAALRSVRRPVHSRGYTSAHVRHISYGGTTSHHYSLQHGARKWRSDAFQQTPMPDRVAEIQTALAQQGDYQGEPSGKWDGAMSDALRSYQERSGLTVTGKLDAASLQHLGLGSDVAGLNPPKTVLPPVSNAPSAGVIKPAIANFTEPLSN